MNFVNFIIVNDFLLDVIVDISVDLILIKLIVLGCVNLYNFKDFGDLYLVIIYKGVIYELFIKKNFEVNVRFMVKENKKDYDFIFIIKVSISCYDDYYEDVFVNFVFFIVIINNIGFCSY